MIFKPRRSPLSIKPDRRYSQKKFESKLVRASAWREWLLPSATEQSVVANRTPAAAVPLLAAAGLLLAAVVMSLRLFDLQVTAHDRYVDLANGNRIRETIRYAQRGNIYDRNGVLLARNILTYQLSVTPYLLPDDTTERIKAYQTIGRYLDVNWGSLQQQAEASGLDYPLPITLTQSIEHDKALALMPHVATIDGFSLNKVPTRQYVADSGLAHIIGYTGIISPQELTESQADRLPIDIVGKSGIELQYDELLRGTNGFERTEVDTFGRPIRLLAQRGAMSGRDITLTIDIKVQRELMRELDKQMKAARVTRASAVALDPLTGEVLAMVSVPFYDNNLFAKGISSADFERLANDPDEPLVNKAIAGGYTTGSTIKPVVASAALQEGVVTPDTIIVDRGAISVTSVYQPGAAFVFRGWRPGGLGPMNVRRAIAMSSNIYFYTVGGGHGGISGLGVERLTDYYRHFGLGERSGIDLPGEIAGRVPDPAWKREVFSQDWYVGDTYNISIGQGDLLVSPLQLTLADMAIANGGQLLKPQLLLAVGDQKVAERTVRRELKVDKSILAIVREGMREVITNGTTCACRFTSVPHPVAGKSGTAQTTSDDSRRPHAWYTAFAPYENPQVYMTVLLEEGSGGSTYAAPVIAAGMAEFFKSNQLANQD